MSSVTRSSNRLPGFRADINGLRAWAVVAVILYHFGIPGFDGGFVGVDVFFVISGFLMTNIVVKSLETGQFSVLAFYGARARRILPALLVLCFVLLLLGYLFLAPLDYKVLAKHTLAVIGFFSNIKFRNEAGYFDAVSHEKWLLHTWSLSVEWQFYLLLPLIVLALWRIRPGRATLIMTFAAGSLVSLATSIIQTDSAASSAFFLLPARAWEMMAGGLVFLLGRAVGKFDAAGRPVEMVGFALILSAVIFFDSNLGWPGWRALVPVVGSMLLLWVQRENSVWTANRVAQWLGDRSYSLYLWHWPIFVGLAYFGAHHDSVWIACGLLLTVLCGDLSCRWAENPARRYLGQLGRKQFALAVSAGILIAAGSAGVVSAGDGLKGRFDPLVDQISNESKNKNPRRQQCHIDRGVESPSCLWGGEVERVIVIGDSHAEALVTAIAAADPVPGLVQWTYSGCPYVQGMKKTEDQTRGFDGYNCERFIGWVSGKLASKPKFIPVILIARYAGSAMGENEKSNPKERPGVYFSRPVRETTVEFLDEYKSHLVETACTLAEQRKVYLVRPTPEMGIHVPKALVRRLMRGIKQDVSIPIADYHQRNAWIWEAQDEAARRCGAEILDPTAYLCDDKNCYGSRDLHPLYRDDDHVSEYGNQLLVPMFRAVYERLPEQVMVVKP